MDRSALDHDCRRGCAKVYLEPKLHSFDDCFYGKIRMGDIDGAVERNGHILWVEWKRGAILDVFEKQHQAQIIMAKAFTRNSPKQSFAFVIGCPIEMTVTRFRVLHSGDWLWPWNEEGGDRFRAFLRYWYAQADKGLTIKGVAA